MKVKFRLNLKTTVAILGGIWGIFAVWYIANDQWQDFQVREKEQAYQMGVEEGRNWAVKKVVEETSKCQQQLPVSYEDKTVNVVSVECLQKSPQAQDQLQPSVGNPASSQKPVQ